MTPAFPRSRFPILPGWRLRLVLAGLCRVLGASAAEPVVGPPPTPGEAMPDVPLADAPAWSFSASVFGYFVRDDDDYIQPTFTADYGALHLEARYQYEARETGSVWVGYNWSGGDQVRWEFTPMLGGVIGETMGVAPGFRGSVVWWWLEFSTEGECVIDAADTSDSFLYNWSELALVPVDWFRAGVATQRTRTYDSDREVSWGPMVGFTLGPFDLAAYGFDLDQETPTLVLALGVEF